MKKVVELAILAVLFFLCFPDRLAAQTTDWINLRADADNFSIQIPANYEVFSEETGFVQTTRDNDEIEFNNVKILTAYYDKAILSVESYTLKIRKKALIC